MSFSTDAYRMFDMPKATAILQLCIIIIMALWISAAAAILW
ncbi:MAG: hypothetical protein Q4D99_07960 [Bacillota bacterium]|nr:hypothetical protein [Bacillota bacterium]